MVKMVAIPHVPSFVSPSRMVLDGWVSPSTRVREKGLPFKTVSLNSSPVYGIIKEEREEERREGKILVCSLPCLSLFLLTMLLNIYLQSVQNSLKSRFCKFLLLLSCS